MGKKSDWKNLLAKYLSTPNEYWPNSGRRQVDKLTKIEHRVHDLYGWEPSHLIEFIIDMATQRELEKTLPLYVMNIGGCGSHWLTRMLEDLIPHHDAGEVYLPEEILKNMTSGKIRDPARILDAVEVLHGLLYRLRPPAFLNSRMINSAHGVRYLKAARLLRPQAKIIHLVRDPRDRTVSVVFRKKKFREYETGGVSDNAYLISKARRSTTHHKHYLASEYKADLQIYYEDLKTDCATTLAHIVETLQYPTTPARLESIAEQYSAAALRKQNISSLGNLDEGGKSITWNKALDKTQRQILHSMCAAAIHNQGYSLCDCFGREKPTVNDSVNANINDLKEVVDEDYIYVLDEHKNNWCRLSQHKHLAPTSIARVVIPGDLHEQALKSDATINNVTALCLSSTSANIQELEHLISKFPNLEYLDLSGASEFDPSILKPNIPLKEINLLNAPVSTDHLASLKKSFPDLIITQGVPTPNPPPTPSSTAPTLQ